MNPLLNFLLGPVLDKVLAYIPDPQKRAEMQLEMAKLQQSAEFKQLEAMLQIATAQSAVNLAEAQSEDKFKSWWRPAAAWICVAGMFFQFVFAPTLGWVMALLGKPVTLPQTNTEVLMTMLFSMLGLGTWRTVDKIKGVA